MKRLLALLLSGIMVLSMAACGNTSSKQLRLKTPKPKKAQKKQKQRKAKQKKPTHPVRSR